jgi:hypothetical protein
MEKKRNVCSVLEENSKGKRPQRRPARRWKDNIKMNFRGVGWDVCGLDSSGSG